VLGEAWVSASMALTALAAGVPVLAVLLTQAEVLRVTGTDRVARSALSPRVRRLSMTTGTYGCCGLLSLSC
jgi:uncharacterized membrane protein